MKYDQSKIKPHATAKLAAYLIGGAALFAMIGGIIVLLGNQNFGVDPFSLGLSKFLSLTVTPVIMFCGTYLFAYALCFLLQQIFRNTKDSAGDA